MTEITYWLLATLFWTMVLSFYSMQEMACISCNKLRLDYAVSQNKRTAIWLQSLLESPQLLFSTTLVGVNVAMMISSESSRCLFVAWGLDPNLAPFAEIPFLLIFGEIIPMFAARLYPDHTSRLGIPLLYASAMILKPIISVFSFFFKSSDKQHHAPYLSRDELQKLLEEHQGGYLGEQDTPENDFIGNILDLRSMQAYQIMQKVDSQVMCLSGNTTVLELREIVKKTPQPFFPVYHKSKTKIIGLVYIQELLNASPNKRLSECTKTAVFIPQDLSALEVIRKLQDEYESGAVVIDAKGVAIGVIFLDDLIDEVFGSESIREEPSDLMYLEKTISADTQISDFNTSYDADIDAEGCKTFAELIEKTLGRHPHLQDIIYIEPFEIVVKETSLFKAKTIQIRSKTP
ncbi:MAG: CNNM domain-containing protein [Chlamydiales bacterium]|nr:CNNM domain-containing protein [Chlamydiales bacterium]